MPTRPFSTDTAETAAPEVVPDPLALDIRGVSKTFGRVAVLKNVSLQAREGEFLALLGPSGSGKTTLLRVLAGLEAPDAGAVRFRGEDFLSLPVRQRRVGMVFQHYALFPHMSVARNVAFGLAVRGRSERPSPDEIAERVARLLDLVQLQGLQDRYPAQLSGGQRQRVALARALAVEPRMLLLDEPFGALDAQVRRELRRWLRDLHDRAGVTTVFVTHDQEEALDLADRVAILNAGELVQLGSPAEVYEQPATPFVFGFLGQACRMAGVVEGGRLRLADWESQAPPGSPHGPVDVFFRPDEVAFAPPSGEGVPVEVVAAARRGSQVRIECRMGGEPMELRGHAQTALEAVAPGARMRVRLLRPQVYARGPGPSAPSAR